MNSLFLRILTVFLLIVGLSFGAFSQNFDNIAASFRSGDAGGIARHFDNNVEITIKSGGNSYSRSQAELVLKNFFSSHQPKNFSIAHQGTSPDGGSKYFIGSLSTAAGNYRTYVYAKQMGGNMVIQEIRFEEQ